MEWKPLSKKQGLVLAYPELYPDSNGIILDGSVRSGKTIALSTSFLIWAMTNFNDEVFALCGFSVKSVRDNVINDLAEIARGEGFSWTDNQAKNEITVRAGTVKNTFRIFGGGNKKSQDSIQGQTWQGAYLDEVVLIHESFYNQVGLRCSRPGAKIFMNCNPGSPTHYIKTDVIDEADKLGFIRYQFFLEDNLTNTPEYIERIKRSYHGSTYSRMIEGQWCQAENLVYSGFDPAKHVIPMGEIEEPLGQPVVGADFGLSDSSTAFLIFRQGKRTGTWYLTKEIYINGKKVLEKSGEPVTVSQLVERLKEGLGGEKPIVVIVDPSAVVLINELRANGFNQVLGANNKVEAGITTTQNFLYDGIIKLTDNAPNTIYEIQGYSYDGDGKDGKSIKVVKVNDHAMDAMRYVCQTFIINNLRPGQITGLVKR